MKTFWTEGMSKQDKEEFMQKFVNSAPVREILVKRLQREIDKLQEQRLKHKPDSSDDWALRQAQINAEEEVYRLVISLVLDK